MIKLLTLFALLLPGPTLAFTKDRLVLKGGVNLSYNQVEALKDSDDGFPALGFNTHFGYRKSWWEVSLSSFTQFGSISPIFVSTNNQQFTLEGSFLDFSVYPNFKHHTSWQPRKNWNFYYGLGPLWSLQSIRRENSTPKTKVSYQSFGLNVMMGIEEIMIYEKMHPVYLELLVGWRSSDKVSLIDVTDFSKVITLSETSIGQDFSQTTIMISLGITLF